MKVLKRDQKWEAQYPVRGNKPVQGHFASGGKGSPAVSERRITVFIPR
jgi:hypothetical protein